ncbi:hypothetical protein NDU88_000888 [Pleurodeles waltl]|uniref:Uncharacterized protein n=1 Tax=Pleurodeles waltl TaxID=8319 RepID=A0AAV7P284_PLEWA|nr:hypothetical protein NDU88_000888 [Pleurodeles waltl]
MDTPNRLPRIQTSDLQVAMRLLQWVHYLTKPPVRLRKRRRAPALTGTPPQSAGRQKPPVHLRNQRKATTVSGAPEATGASTHPQEGHHSQWGARSHRCVNAPAGGPPQSVGRQKPPVRQRTRRRATTVSGAPEATGASTHPQEVHHSQRGARSHRCVNAPAGGPPQSVGRQKPPVRQRTSRRSTTVSGAPEATCVPPQSTEGHHSQRGARCHRCATIVNHTPAAICAPSHPPLRHYSQHCASFCLLYSATTTAAPRQLLVLIHRDRCAPKGPVLYHSGSCATTATSAPSAIGSKDSDLPEPRRLITFRQGPEACASPPGSSLPCCARSSCWHYWGPVSGTVPVCRGCRRDDEAPGAVTREAWKRWARGSAHWGLTESHPLGPPQAVLHPAGACQRCLGTKVCGHRQPIRPDRDYSSPFSLSLNEAGMSPTLTYIFQSR